MTDQKISQLADGGALQPGDLIPVARAGANYAISGTKLLALVGSGSGSGPSSGGYALAHKAWRIRIDDTQDHQFCSLSTMDLPDAATGGIAFSSPCAGATYPEAAFDPFQSSLWAADMTNGFPVYLGYIWPEAITAEHVMLQCSSNNDQMPTKFTLEYSDDTTTGFDGTWSTATVFTSAYWDSSTAQVFQNTGPVATTPSSPAGDSAAVTALQADVTALQNDVTAIQSNATTLAGRVSTLEARPVSSGSGGSGGSSSGATTEIVAGVSTSVDGVSSTGYRSKGTSLTPTQNVVVTGLSFLITSVAGVTYTASIWSMTGTTLVSQVYVSDPLSPGASDPYTAKFNFSPVTLNANQTYAVLLTASTGSLLSYYTTAASVQSAVLPIRSMRGMRIDAVPTAQASLEDTGGPYIVNLYTTVGGGSTGAAASPFVAGGTFEFAGSNTPTIMDVKGCTVTRLDGGRYQVVFDTPMPDANYGVLCSGKWGPPDNAGSYQAPVIGMDRGYNNATTANGFYLISETYAGGSSYDARVFFAVYKNAAALLGL